MIPQLSRFIHNKNTTDWTRKLCKMHKLTTKFCRDNPNILFTRADKGNVTVAMTKEYYINKMENILKDNSTYSII